MITAWLAVVKVVAGFASGMGPPLCRGASFRSGILWGCRGFSGAARVCPQGRAERAFAVAGVLGQAVLPGRGDAPGLPAIFEGGPGCRGQRPRVQYWVSWLLARLGDGWLLPVPVGLAVEDQFVGGGLEPVDG